MKHMEINKKTWLRLLGLVTAALLIGFGLQHFDAVLSCISAVFAILSPIFLGICIAFIVNVPMRPLERLWNTLFCRESNVSGTKKGRRLKHQLSMALRRPLCLILSFLLIAGLLFAVVFMLIPQLGKACKDFAAMMPDYLRDLEALWGQAQAALDDFGFVIPDFAIDITKWNTDTIFGTVKDFFAQWGGHILDTTVSITATVFSGVFNVVLALVFSIYMLAQKEMLCYQLTRILRALFSEANVKKITDFADLVNRTFTNFITGQLTEAVIIGVLCGIGMTVFRMPYAFVVSVIVGFTALIPVFGAYVGTGIGAFLILLAQPIKALWFVVFIIVLQQLEGNLIYPRVVGKSVGLPGLLVLAAVTVGSSIGGILGMLLAVPVCSVIFTVCSQAVDARLRAKTGQQTENAEPACAQAVISDIPDLPLPAEPAKTVTPARANAETPARANAETPARASAETHARANAETFARKKARSKKKK